MFYLYLDGLFRVFRGFRVFVINFLLLFNRVRECEAVSQAYMLATKDELYE